MMPLPNTTSSFFPFTTAILRRTVVLRSPAPGAGRNCFQMVFPVPLSSAAVYEGL
ncbi:MAG: hypothetical protein IT165_37075 [Bryobacterales bacterium]|nr:hypothetical protein [Bryobacterales bacterium]